MRLRKAIKKIAALATGATMLGATLMGAMAADLANYPDMFISDGTMNGALVVGKNAAAEDVIGAVDIATGIQYGASVVVAADGGGVALEGDAWEVKTSSDILEIGENFTDVQTYAGSDELNALADGTFKNQKGSADYEQELRWGPTSPGLVYEEDTDLDKVSDFVKVSDNANYANYTLTFQTQAESDIDTTKTDEYDDLDNEKITILGQEYTIITADRTAQNDVDLTLMAGALQDVMEQGQIKTYTLDGKDYEVEVIFIGTSGGASKVKFKINGETTDALAEGETFTLADGTDIGVREILEEEAGEVTADQVEFYLGASKIVLEDTNISNSASSNNLKVGEETIDDVDVIIKGTDDGSTLKLDSIRLVYTAGDNFWIGPGEKLSENANMEEPQGLLNWDIEYVGLTDESIEAIDFVAAGDDRMQLKTTVESGDVTIPLAYSADANSIRLGDRNDKLVLNTSNVVDDQYVILTDKSVANSGAKSYVLQYKGATSPTDGNPIVKFKNVATGDTIEKSFVRADAQTTLTLGGQEYTIANTSSAAAGNKNFNISISGGIVTTAGAQLFDDIATKGGAYITILDTNESFDGNGSVEAPIQITIDLIDGTDVTDELDPANVVFNISDAGDADQLDISGTSSITGLNWITDPDDSDFSTAINSYGAKFTYESVSSAPNKLTIEFPENQRAGQALVTSGEVKATIVVGEAGATATKIDIPPAKLDSEISDVTAQNLIVVGGPCANSVASAVSGIPQTEPECYEQYTEGKAKIKLYEQTTGKVAMLVAGFAALDTRRATRVLKNYKDYDLSGDEVEVSGTSLTDISVSGVTA